MSSSAIATVIKMMESLPVDVQEQVAEHLREYINDLQDEIQWNQSFEKTQTQLVAAARRAKQEIAEGKATAMDYDQLCVGAIANSITR
ncbi:MAG: hypothetical protein QNJ47_19575 [Nostocaceae cyanobacterium]|nr:hypothetical protein [Nostocaceae cyanobacterium]